MNYLCASFFSFLLGKQGGRKNNDRMYKKVYVLAEFNEILSFKKIFSKFSDLIWYWNLD